MNKTSVAVVFCLSILASSLAFGAIAVDAASPPTGFSVCKPGFGPPQCTAIEFANPGNLAWPGNGFALPAVARDNISAIYATIHRPEYANDGFYGNGSSWIGNSPGSWIKIDLGREVLVDSLRLGRDRNGGFDDRDPGTVLIEVATSDNVYANGDDSNDAAEYTVAMAATPLAIAGPTTYKASFPPVVARYVKVTLAILGAAIDEIEVAGAVAGACCTDGPGTMSECIETNQTDCEADGGLFVGWGTLCADVLSCTELAVSMSSMSATELPKGTLISWTTATEVDTVGFRVLRQSARGEKAMEVLGQMIPAAGFGYSGATYRFLDNTARTGTSMRYYIEDIDTYGRVTLHGPIEVTGAARVKPGARKR